MKPTKALTSKQNNTTTAIEQILRRSSSNPRFSTFLSLCLLLLKQATSTQAYEFNAANSSDTGSHRHSPTKLEFFTIGIMMGLCALAMLAAIYCLLRPFRKHQENKDESQYLVAASSASASQPAYGSSAVDPDPHTPIRSLSP